jgi:hypothetical protein
VPYRSPDIAGAGYGDGSHVSGRGTRARDLHMSAWAEEGTAKAAIETIAARVKLGFKRRRRISPTGHRRT